jgi:hypothetical protein
VLDPGPDEPDDPQPPPPDRSTPTVIVNIDAAPDRTHKIEVAITESSLAEAVEVAFYCGGSPAVTQVITSVEGQLAARRGLRRTPWTHPPPSAFPPAFRSIPPPDPIEIEQARDPIEHARAEELTTAIGLLRGAERDLRDRIVDALAEVDDAARRVFLEELTETRVRCALTRCGLFEDAYGPSGSPANVLPAVSPAGEQTYRRLRAGIVGLDGLARGVQETEKIAGPYDPPGVADLAEPLAARRKAREAFLAEWYKLIADFPVLAVVARDVLTATGGMDLHDLTIYNRGHSYLNPLDLLIRKAVTAALRDAWKAGPSLAKDYLEAADQVRAHAATLADPADVLYGENHPLFAYPLIVWGGLQRIGAAPNTLEYAATASALAIAAAAAARRAAAASAYEELMNAIQLGFGVATMIPVVGAAAGVAGGVIAALRAIIAISDYQSDTRRRQAFGVYADRLEIPDPDGLGVVLTVAGLVPDMLPILGPAAKLAGRYLRVAALGAELAPATQAAEHAIGVRGADFLPLVLEALGIGLGREMERRARLPIPAD